MLKVRRTCKSCTFGLLRLTIYSLTFSLFALQCYKVFIRKDMTTIAESRDVKKKMKLPAITLCPGLAYKNQSGGGPYLKEAEFQRNAFNLSDLFKETWFFQKKKSKYKIMESRNIYNGRCYTIYFLSKCASSALVRKLSISAQAQH